MEQRLYYERNEHREPIITVVILEEDGVYYKGTAMCSPKDKPVKQYGRMLAEGRATKAMLKGNKTAVCPDGLAFKKCCVLKPEQLTTFERQLFRVSP